MLLIGLTLVLVTKVVTKAVCLLKINAIFPEARLFIIFLSVVEPFS